MKSINFIARWANDKPQTWSGTIWGLFTSLKKYYKIEDVDISKIKSSLFSRLKSGMLYLLGKPYGDMGISLIKKTRKYILGLQFNSNIFIQFDESAPNTDTNKNYIFLDESVDHILYMRLKQPEMFNTSNYHTANLNCIKKRASQQNDYFRKCAGIFTMGKWLANDLVQRTGIPREKVHYVGSGVNVDIEKIDGSKKEGNKILFVGKDFIRKGGGIIVKSFKLLKERMPSAELYVAGPVDNPVIEPIPGYHFMGLCNREQINDLYNKCDVFAMPSYFEAFGIVFVEALTFGLPCLVRNCQEMPYLVEHGKTGIVIDDDNVETIANYMYELLNDKSFKQNVSAMQSFYVENYSWDAVAKRICKIIS